MQKQLDWLAFSKLSPNNAQNMFQLSNILKGSTVSREMFNRLPKSYLNKFFLTVQTQLLNYNNNQPQFEQILNIKSKERQEVVERMRMLEGKMGQSKQDLDDNKKEVDELELVLERLEKKLAKMKHYKKKEAVKPIVKQESFYCPYCRIDGFSNRDNFQNHMLTQHPLRNEDDKVNTMKEVVLALKQKQMALMEMVLKRNQDMVDINRKLAEQQWSFKTKHFQTAQQFGSHPSVAWIESQKQPELASQTEFVWFEKENNARKANMNFMNEYETNRSEYHKSQNFITDKKEKNVKSHQGQKLKYIEDQQIPYEIEIVSAPYKPPTLKEQFDLGTRLGLYTTQKQPLKKYKIASEQCENSLYQTKNLSKITSGYHIYCAGPLEDDQSDSEAADYFNVKSKPKIIDEQIQVPQHLLKKINTSTSIPNTNNKQNTSNNQINNHSRTHTAKTLNLLSPKSAEKTQKSGMNSLLFSVEDKDFSLSKDSASINLSDLKYEDLLIKKEQQKKHQEQELPSIHEFIKQSSHGFTKKVSNEKLLSEFYESDFSDMSFHLPMKKISSYKSNGSLLDEFVTSKAINEARHDRKSNRQSPKNKSRRSEISQQKTSSTEKLSRQKIEKIEKPSHNSLTIPQIPKSPHSSTISDYVLQIPSQSAFHRMQESQVNYKQLTSRNDSEPPTQRLILETLIDLTLIRQEELEQSIDNKM